LYLKQLIVVIEAIRIGFTPDVDKHAVGVVNYYPGAKGLDDAESPVVA
jgi:hypothetical protein